jgi:hypothetical protein
MLPQRENRRHERIPYLSGVHVSWEDESGLNKYARAKGLDISAEGLRIELSEPIPVFSRLSLRADQINMGGSASVRHARRHGCKYVLGLSLSQSLEKAFLRRS